MADLTTGKQCEALNTRGEPCSTPALRGSRFCFHHDPANAVQRLAARAKGGKARHGRTIGPTAVGDPVSVKSTADVVRLLEGEINSVLLLERSLNRARTVGYLALAALKAHELNELSDRVAALEMALKARETR